MTTRPIYDSSILDSPVRVVALGHLSWDEKGPIVTVGGNSGGTLRSVRMTSGQGKFYDAQTPARLAAPGPSSPAGHVLVDMANAGLFAPLPGNVGVAGLPIIPILRKPLEVTEDNGDAGIRFSTGEDSFVLPPLAALFLPHVDGTRTLSDIAEIVKAEGQGPEDLWSVLEHAAYEQGVAADDILASAALSLVAEMRPSGAATFELAD